MLRAVQVVLLVCVSVWGQTGGNPGASLNDLAAAAKEAQGHGDYALAAGKYRAILELRPDLSEARFNFGLMLHLAGKYSEAATNLRQFLQRDPDSFPANLMVGVELLRMRQGEEAIVFLEHARKLQPEDAQVLLNLAQAELLTGKFGPAYLNFADLTREQPRNSDAWYGLGLSSLGAMRVSLQELSLHARDTLYTKVLLAASYARRGYWKRADEIYTALLGVNEPKCIASSLGVVRLHENDAAGAGKLFRQDLTRGCSAAAAALDRVPGLSGNNAQETVMQSPVEGSGVTADADDIPEPVWNYEHCPKTSSIQSVAALKDSETEWLHAVACADQEQSYAKAFSLLRTRLAITPQDPAALYWSVRVMRHSAFSALAQVTNIDPTSIQLHLLLAHILLDQEKLQPAEVEYRKVLDRDPLAIQAHLGLAMAEYRSRDFEAAIPELQKVLSLAPRDSEANYLLGSILILQQQYDRAKPLLIQAKKSASATNAVPIHARLAEAYAETGDLPGAIKELKSCLSADIDGRYHYRLSLLYRKLGDRAAADAALRKYSELRNNTELAESIAEIQ